MPMMACKRILSYWLTTASKAALGMTGLFGEGPALG